MFTDLPSELMSHVVESVGTTQGVLPLTRVARVSKGFKTFSQDAFRKNHCFFPQTSKVEYAGTVSSVCLTENGKLCVATPLGVTIYDYEDGIELCRMPLTIVTNSNRTILPRVTVASVKSHIFVTIEFPTSTLVLIMQSCCLDVVSSFSTNSAFTTSFHESGFEMFNTSQDMPLLNVFSCPHSPPDKFPFPWHIVATTRHQDELYTLDEKGYIRKFDPATKRLYKAFQFRIKEPNSLVSFQDTIVVCGKHLLAAFEADGTLVRLERTDDVLSSVTMCQDTLLVLRNQEVFVHTTAKANEY